MALFDQKSKDFFNNDFQKRDPGLLLFIMVISCGFYLISWIYQFNKDFNSIGIEKPDYNWGVLVLFIMPVGWLIVHFLSKLLINNEFNYYNYLLSIGGWLIIMILILKYLYDICYIFGFLTKTHFLIWYFALYPGFLAVFLYFLDFYWTIPLIAFTIVCIPAMQAQLNDTFEKIWATGRKENYYLYRGK